jgi:hypothetical protein
VGTPFDDHYVAIRYVAMSQCRNVTMEAGVKVSKRDRDECLSFFSRVCQFVGHQPTYVPSQVNLEENRKGDYGTMKNKEGR